MRHTDLNADLHTPHDAPLVFEVLVVDDEPDIREVLEDALEGRVNVRVAGSVAEARRIAADHEVDVALLDVKLPDGDGLDFAEELRQFDPTLQTIVMTGKPSLKRAVQAMRLGAVDFLAKPIDLDELNACLDRALDRRARDARDRRKVTRLRKLCRRLNRARHEVTQQVDILCNDLVSAYQELAGQMKHVQVASQFKALLDQELDLEQVLRRVLEFVLQQVGSTNAAVFLPSMGGGWTTGGYINYTFDKETAGVLLSHLADVAAPRIAEAKGPIHFTDNEAIRGWLGEDSAWLDDCHVVGLQCMGKDQVMAAVLLFRDAGQPFDAASMESLESITPILGEHLAKVVGIHHRLADFFKSEDSSGGDSAAA